MHSPVLSLLLTLSAVAPSLAAYTLKDDYSGDTFYSGFNFFNDADPTKGFVNYVSMDEANSTSLAGFVQVPAPPHSKRQNTSNTSTGPEKLVFLGTDATTNNPSAPGRASTRVTSKKSYNHGLFIFDIQHAPTGCGVWPAAWLLADTTKYTWPSGGEIDIMENVNTATANQITMHTNQGCKFPSNKSPYTGALLTQDCDVNSSTQDKNAGCGISDSQPASFGVDFNTAGGGIYATEWSSQGIKVWFFGRNSTTIPADLAAATSFPSGSAAPNPDSWGTPVGGLPADACNINDHFKDMQIIFNTALCGEWAGDVWTKNPTCMAKAPTCQAYAAGNGANFAEAYWAVRSVRVFQQG